MIYRSREMECLEAISSSSKKKKKSRFSEEQIRSLEVMFESDTKLEAKKKAEVATELGLQPRQVAIWFQNKRARWKSKHLESEFNTLLNNYNNLTSQYECLKKHNLSLLAQIEELQKVKYKGSGSDEESSADYIIHGYSCSCKNATTDDDSHDHDQVVKINNNISGVSSDDDADHNDDGRRKAEFLQGLMDDDDGRELLKMVEPHHHVSVDQDWGNLNDITSSLPWWDFWS